MRPGQALRAARALGRTGLFQPVRPADYVRMALLARRWGASLAAGSAISALRAPHQTAIGDEWGCLSWRELDDAANSVACALSRQGVGPGTSVALMCRNHRYFVEAALAVSKLGADLILLNTDFGTGQLGYVLERERVSFAIFDDEFAAAFDTTGFGGTRYREANIRAASSGLSSRPLMPPGLPGRVVIMTSGTTGAPKGAQRSSITPPLDVIISGFSRLPLRARETVVVSPPLFHGLGLGFLGCALMLQGTLVIRRRFDPEAVLAVVARHRATTLVAVPVMLHRILALPQTTRHRYDTSSLRLIVCSGSALGADLASSVMDAFGDILYNFYGSTEIGWVTVADPVDLRTAPGTVGRPPGCIRVAILDKDGRAVPRGRSGRIFVGSGMAFEGYTGGGGKQVIRGLMDTGDVGHLDESGRLFVDGRSDDMIVSGGENVFPGEVEDLLRAHEHVLDAAVVGVDDQEMGQRLVAFIVPKPGSSLSTGDVQQYVRSHLARYKIPGQVEFVERIPRNPTGKVLRKSLQDPCA